MPGLFLRCLAYGLVAGGAADKGESILYPLLLLHDELCRDSRHQALPERQPECGVGEGKEEVGAR